MGWAPWPPPLPLHAARIYGLQKVHIITALRRSTVPRSSEPAYGHTKVRFVQEAATSNGSFGRAVRVNPAASVPDVGCRVSVGITDLVPRFVVGPGEEGLGTRQAFETAFCFVMASYVRRKHARTRSPSPPPPQKKWWQDVLNWWFVKSGPVEVGLVWE